MRAFKLGVLSSGTYTSEALNCTVQKQLKRRQHDMEKLKQVREEETRGHLNLQCPKRGCVGDDEQPSSAEVGNVSRGKGPELQ